MRLAKEEEKIVKKIIKKDERTLFYFYNQHKKTIFNFINRQIKDRHLSEEITQDVFLDFIEYLRDFRGEASLKTFLFRIARNKVIDYIRKDRIKKILFSNLPLYLVESLKAVLIDEEIEKKELKEKIRKVFEKLPNDYGIILRLKYING